MLKVGIFGDSYADPISHGHDNFKDMDQLGWPNLLKYKYEVGLHGKTGSSIFYSYQQFLKYHEQYDKIVFVVTNPERWVKSVSVAGEQKNVSTYIVAEHFLKQNNLTIEERCILEALKSYYLFLEDQESTHIFGKLMIDHMKLLRPDIILIPIGRGTVGLDTVGFFDYSVAFHSDMSFFNSSIEWGVAYARLLETYYEYRLICHFSPEINELIATDVLDALEIGKWDPIIPKPIKHPQGVDYYWDKISNISR